MKLAILQTCTEDQHIYPRETSFRADWFEQAPEKGDLVAMGWQSPGEKRWQVVRVDLYKPTSLVQAVSEVYLLHVHPVDQPIPPESEWYCNSTKADYPDEVIYAEATAVNEPLVGMGYAVDGHCPRLGENIPSDWEQLAPVDEFGSAPLRPIPGDLFVESFDTYLPATDAPYPTFYLSWCKVKTLQVA